MIPFRNIEPLRKIIKESTGLEISYAYDDLVFPEHTVFIFQTIDEQPDTYRCFFSEECKDTEKDKLQEKIAKAAKANRSKVIMSGAFALKQAGNEIEIEFK